MPKFECPHCSQRIDASDELAETNASCPKCGKKITVPKFADSKPLKKLPPLSEEELAKIDDAKLSDQAKLAEKEAKRLKLRENERRRLRDAEPTGMEGEQAHDSSRKFIGAILMFFGIGLLAYFILVFSTTVETEGVKVNNIGLLNAQLSGIIVSIGCSVVGSIFYIGGILEDKLQEYKYKQL